ncbi:AraC family transcriptional regulator [Nocardioides humilatus]|uniref:AraC family transcriptional regulator n=2 Tax=Nocardioides humilatus TaxID=2607660 RepID=A0A5B1LQQ1_9ACTN|nr:AraC family transcriptional regulator [Nocardioides humilatus]
MGTLLLVRLGVEHGLTADEVLTGARLGMDDLESGRSESTTAAEQQVIRNLVAAAPPGTTWGLDAGRRYHLTTFGIWGFALVSAATVQEAVDVGLRFIDLTSALTAPYADVDEDGDLRMVFHDPAEPDDVARFIVQRDVTAVQTILEEVVGRGARFKQVTFSHHPTPGTAARYAEAFGVEPEFGAERTSVVFDPSLLGERLPQADEHTSALAQAQCRDLLDRRQQRAGLAGQVRDLIIARLRRPPSVLEVAAALNLSERTLRRRLAAEETSVRILTDEVRAGLAAELLVSRSLTVAEIADRLGYVEVSSFSQAFRRWHGVSARTYLAEHAP